MPCKCREFYDDDFRCRLRMCLLLASNRLYDYALRTCDLIAHQHAWSVVMIEICNNWCWVVLSVSINFAGRKSVFFISIKLPRENERVDATCWWYFFDTLKMRKLSIDHMEKLLTSLCRFWRFSRLAGINIESLYLLFLCAHAWSRSNRSEKIAVLIWRLTMCTQMETAANFQFSLPNGNISPPTTTASFHFSSLTCTAALLQENFPFSPELDHWRAQASSSSYNLFQTKVRSAVARYGNINSTRFVGICERARKKFDELRNENENENSRWKQQASKREEKKEDKL